MSVTQIISGTPWWVWVIFIYVLIKGYQVTKDRIISLYKMMIVPIIFILLTLHTLFSLPMDFGKLVILGMAGIFGIGAGFWEISRLFLVVDKKQKLIKTPGSFIPLILILAVFGSKYYFGYQLAIDPSIAHNFFFAAAFLIISGLCTGIFVGRSACYVCRFMSLPHQNLTAKP